MHKHKYEISGLNSINFLASWSARHRLIDGETGRNKLALLGKISTKYHFSPFWFLAILKSFLCLTPSNSCQKTPIQGNRAGTVTNISEVFQYSISWVDLLIFGEREGRLILRHFDCEIQFSHSLSNLKIHLSTGDKTTNQQYKTDHQNFNHRHDDNEGYIVRA